MIYFIEAVGLDHIKIGRTNSKLLASRLVTLQTGNSFPLRVLGTLAGINGMSSNIIVNLDRVAFGVNGSEQAQNC